MLLSQKIYKLEELTNVSLTVHNREDRLKGLAYWECEDNKKTAEVNELVNEVLEDLGLDQYVYYHNDDNGPTKYEKEQDFINCNRRK